MPARELAGQVQRRHAWQASRVAGLGLDHLPGAVILPPLDRGRLQSDAGCRRGVIGLRVGILDPAGQAENQRIRRAESAEPVAEIKNDSVLFGIADPALELANVSTVRRSQCFRIAVMSRPVEVGCGTGSTTVRQART